MKLYKIKPSEELIQQRYNSDLTSRDLREKIIYPDFEAICFNADFMNFYQYSKKVHSESLKKMQAYLQMRKDIMKGRNETGLQVIKLDFQENIFRKLFNEDAVKKNKN